VSRGLGPRGMGGAKKKRDQIKQEKLLTWQGG
jgi:hypothetical protein